jgi:hypothetical protein
VERVNSSMMPLIPCKNLCKCYNVSPPSTTIREKVQSLKVTTKSYLPCDHKDITVIQPVSFHLTVYRHISQESKRKSFSNTLPMALKTEKD